MGRTEATHRGTLEELEFEWRDYRRGLTREEQARFDRLWHMARLHASAASNADRVNPMETTLMSIALEFLGRIEAIERRLAPEGAKT